MVNIGMALFSFFSFRTTVGKLILIPIVVFFKNALKVHFKFTMVYAEIKSKLFYE